MQWVEISQVNPGEGDGVPLEWFALRVRSNCEKVVAQAVDGKGFEAFLPVYQSRRRWTDRVKVVEMPLFAGYVFCRMDPRRRLPILTIPGAIQFVGIGNIPAPIDNSEISAIQTAVRSGLPAEPWMYVGVGERVRLEEGPLSGLEGILIEQRKQFRVVVSVTLLKRAVAVEIDRSWIAPVGRSVGIPVSW
jgi:transcription antitermination factor NusG